MPLKHRPQPPLSFFPGSSAHFFRSLRLAYSVTLLALCTGCNDSTAPGAEEQALITRTQTMDAESRILDERIAQMRSQLPGHLTTLDPRGLTRAYVEAQAAHFENELANLRSDVTAAEARLQALQHASATVPSLQTPVP